MMEYVNNLIKSEFLYPIMISFVFYEIINIFTILTKIISKN
jgi:hypothetical protein